MTRRFTAFLPALACSGVFLLHPAIAAHAQDVATTFEELRLKVGPGATIYITEQTGDEYAAKVVSLSATALLVTVDGTGRELNEPGIRRIRQRLPDGLWAGALVGLGIGVGLGAVAAGVSETCSSQGGLECAGPPLMAGLLGAGAGAGIDALIKGKKVIYEPPARRTAWNLSPVIAPNGAGARLTMVF